VKHVTHFVDGKPWDGVAARRGDIYDPATGEVSGQVDFASTADVAAVVAAAKKAAEGWREASLSKRTAVMFAFREILAARRDELAALITDEHGKVLSDAAGEVQRGIEVVEYACGVGTLLRSGFAENVSTGVDSYAIRQPLGVVGVISPFNFPAMVPLWFLPIAVAAGNAVVLKPSEKDPSAAVKLAEWFHEAGLPEGVFNVVHGDKEAVDALLDHPDVKSISFVGSTPIARYVYERGTAAGKRVQALGGAKNHMVVLPDADIDLTADAAVSAGFGSAGERCMAISVVVAVGDVADPLVDAIAARLPKLRIGDGTDPDSEMGPLITREHRDKVASYVGQGVEAGAVAVVDGREADVPSDGFFLGTTLLDRVSPDMTVYTDEIFGPVLCVVRSETYDEGLDLINRNQFANGTAIFTRDGGAARQFQFDVEVGMVGVNVPIPVPVSYYSFGGWKASLFGDTHMYGPEGIAFYTRGKVVTSRWPDPATSTIDLGFPTHR
jgi:malonate-semialdehyde dehydrogenase (acetylating)/methylmalonate-semialdehyde dehydrogenase